MFGRGAGVRAMDRGKHGAQDRFDVSDEADSGRGFEPTWVNPVPSNFRFRNEFIAAPLSVITARPKVSIGDENARLRSRLTPNNGAAPCKSGVVSSKQRHLNSGSPKRPRNYARKLKARRPVSNVNGLSGAPGRPKRPPT